MVDSPLEALVAASRALPLVGGVEGPQLALPGTLPGAPGRSSSVQAAGTVAAGGPLTGLPGGMASASRPGSTAPAIDTRSSQPGDSPPELSGVPSRAALALRPRLGRLLAALAERADERLPRALALASTAWDQVDRLELFSEETTAEVAQLRSELEALLGGEAPSGATRAVALEVRLLLDQACRLVQLVERRFAAIVRLRLRSGADSALLVEGRPFLDLGAALREAARSLR